MFNTFTSKSIKILRKSMKGCPESIKSCEKILKYDLWDVNNKDNPAQYWAAKAVVGKINQCYKRMKSEWVPKLMDDPSVSAISASKDEFVGQVISNPSYMNRYHSEVSSSYE